LSVYVESSFLVSLYSPDVHSETAQRIIQAAREDLWLTALVEIEVVNALSQTVFRKESSLSQAQASLRAFDQDLRVGAYRMKPLPENVFVRARQVSRETTPRLGTRTLDLLHVAAALELGADEFYTFDRQQGKLAKEMKLKVNLIS
jgi:predicted nucleic acid-binding protein